MIDGTAKTATSPTGATSAAFGAASGAASKAGSAARAHARANPGDGAVVTPVTTIPASIAGASPSGTALVAALITAGPPIDTDRVAQTKMAIANGTYATDPERIAAAMIASDGAPPR